MLIQRILRTFAAVVATVIGLALAASTWADDAAGCKDPAWAPAPVSGFALASCRETPWVSIDVRVAGKTKTLQGARSEVLYGLVGKAPRPNAPTVVKFIVGDLQKRGAALVSDPADSGRVILTRTGPQGEFWYIYDQMGGNSDSVPNYNLTMVQISPLPQEVQAQINTGDLDTRSVPCKEPPWLVKQFPYFKLAGCEGHELQELMLHLTSGTKTLSGKTMSNIYSLTERNRRPTTIALQKNFISALQKIGATLVSDPTNVATAVLTRTSAQGEYWYVYEQAEGNSDAVSSYKLTTVQIAQLVQEVQAQSNASDLDTHSAQCKDPSWLVKQFSYFKLESCRGVDFQEIALSLPAGRKILAGKSSMSLYVLSDINRRPTGMVVQKNYVNALQQIGAKLVSDPSNSGQIVFTRTVPQGEFWYIYDQAGGSSDAVPAYRLTTVQIAPLLQEVQAQATPTPLEAATTGCKDPSWLVKQFSYFKLESCNFADIDAITLDLDGGKKTLAGRILHHAYALTDHVREPVSIAVWRNYVNALQAIGAKLVSIPTKSDEAVLTRTTPQGVFWYIYRQSGGGVDGVSSYDLITVHVGGPPTKACTMEIYGVNFDFNIATLRPDSDPVLNQVLALFSADPAYTGEIGGHTDNIGKPDYNLKLSGQRADAVKAWLVANGVSATRLTTHGYGDTKPLVPNTSDENRFKNRRVELKRANCK